jgi:CRP-like cAMP-binding protein
MLPHGHRRGKEGDAGTEAYRITQGYVTIWKTEDGQRVNLATRGEGEIVGEMALIDEVPRSATVTADDALEVEVITKADLDAMMEASPEVLKAILEQLMESIRCANDLISMYASRPPS